MSIDKTRRLDAHTALPGRAARLWTLQAHTLWHRSLEEPFPVHWQHIYFGMGCFWGAEKKFWAVSGVELTAVGYMAGFTPHPTYEEVCSGLTGHNEVVRVWFDPSKVEIDTLLKVFWENHDPTQGMRQGNDRGTQYRSAIYVCHGTHKQAALHSRHAYGEQLRANGYGAITTEILDETPFYYAENDHQQYLYKHPNGYCGLGGTGVSFYAKRWQT